MTHKNLETQENDDFVEEQFNFDVVGKIRKQSRIGFGKKISSIWKNNS